MTKPLSPRVLLMIASLALIAASSQRFVRLAEPDDPVLSRDWFDQVEQRYLDLGPGVPALLPGKDRKLGTHDDEIRQDVVGDIDLVVRLGTAGIIGAIPDPTAWLPGPLPEGVAEPMGGSRTTTIANTSRSWETRLRS